MQTEVVLIMFNISWAESGAEQTLRDEDRSHKTANQPYNQSDQRWPLIRCEEAFFL